MHKTSAWPLALVYTALVVYASLYPFADWRDQGIAAWAFLAAPLPKYWTGFDVMANVLGYAPLGFLLALSALRTGKVPSPIAVASVAAGLLSLVMEGLQSYLPSRVPSNVDWVLNVGGAFAGAVSAALLERLGALDRWGRFRERWFVADARGALVLLALWPVALLFPPAVPLSLGQVLERVELALAEALSDTPFLEWLPMREVEMQPLVPGVELLCVVLGALVPCLLGFCVVRSLPKRAVFIGAIFSVGIGATVLSAAMSYGPGHAWAWLNLPVRVGLTVALVLAILMLPLPRRGCAALVLLGLVLHLSLLNQAPTSAYFAQTLQTWEQGRFIRFHGLVQWLGWLWPYAALAYVVHRVSRRETNA
ncbi:MAG TPA: VanZ family protein [Burkholderiaceae bacterium]|nr:VanZ family protein [Burkholderiaceae bacterium]